MQRKRRKNFNFAKYPRLQAILMGLIFSSTCLAFAIVEIFSKHPSLDWSNHKNFILSFFDNYHWWEWIFVAGAVSSLFAQQTVTAYFASYHTKLHINDRWNAYFNFVSTIFLLSSIIFLDDGSWHFFAITCYTMILAIWDWRTLRNNAESNLHHEYIKRLREAFHIDLPVAVALGIFLAAYVYINNFTESNKLMYVSTATSHDSVKIIDVVFAGVTGFQMLVVTGLLFVMLRRWGSPIKVPRTAKMS